jgi:hypothetical protein
MGSELIVKKSTRRYAAIWAQLKETGSCEIKCDPNDTITLVQMVRKEKLQDKTKEKGKIVKHTVTTKVIDGEAITYIKFRLVNDTSIRNL